MRLRMLNSSARNKMALSRKRKLAVFLFLIKYFKRFAKYDSPIITYIFSKENLKLETYFQSMRSL